MADEGGPASPPPQERRSGTIDRRRGDRRRGAPRPGEFDGPDRRTRGTRRSNGLAGRRISVAHDYLTQRGGAERVALELLGAFPGAQLYVTAYDPASTFEEFADVDIRHVPWLSRLARRFDDVRLVLPLILPALRALGPVSADIVVCSSSGWAHGIRTPGTKIVYCHNPARWLYQPDAYFAGYPRLLRRALALALAPLRRWDARAASSVDLYLANSENVANRIRRTYGREAIVVHPPRGLDVGGPQEPVPGLEPGFYLTVGRRRNYKRSAEVVSALAGGDRHLVQVGGQPVVAEHVTQLQGINDATLRWLYANARALIAVGDEDFGLTPVECYAFGTPAIVLASGGYLETSSPVATVLVHDVSAASIRSAVADLEAAAWDRAKICEHAEQWSVESFRARLHEAIRSA